MKGIQLWPPITSPCTHILPPTAVQLVSLFQVVFIALVQAALLRHKLPWALWPAAALMIGGAASEWHGVMLAVLCPREMLPAGGKPGLMPICTCSSLQANASSTNL